MGLSQFAAEIFAQSPFAGFETTGYRLDLQGWQSQHPVFARIIDAVKPGLIIEVGTWKGASAIHMAGLAKRHRPDCRLICVDTWTASNKALWVEPKNRALMTLRHGFPQVYWQFLANVSLSGHSDVILPLPVTSSCAAEILSHYGVFADLIYIDGGHQEDEVFTDLKSFWPLLRPGGYMIGDDYADYWPGVVKAVLTFFAERGHRVGSQRAKWIVRKPQPAAGDPRSSDRNAAADRRPVRSDPAR